MAFDDDLRALLEREEAETAGAAFGGTTEAIRKSYRVDTIRNWIVATPAPPTTPLTIAIARAREWLAAPLFRWVVECLVRYSFLIELTNLTVGSTKMKSRWLPGFILMPQPGSFEPHKSSFQPGNDPRASSFNDCATVFATACNLVCDQIAGDASIANILLALSQYTRVPYEFPLSYLDLTQPKLHQASNVNWVLNDDLKWLLKAREVLATKESDHRVAIRAIIKKKFEVKVFKTDRSLTGKDKTNRAKRWEVLPGDFQHATLEQCWSGERQLTTDLVGFAGFPTAVRQAFLDQNLLPAEQPQTCCPVTLEPLNFATLS